MRRSFIALLVALVAALGATAPAAAADGSTVDVVVGLEAGGLHVVEDVPAWKAAATIDRYENDPDVAFAEVDVPVHMFDVTPNDPGWSQQWGPAMVGAPIAWETTTGKDDVVVAVLDTGVDESHPDLAGAVLPGYDLIDGDSEPDDPHGHGTMVAGVVAARGNNARGVAGYCWSCRILPVRVLDANGEGSSSGIAFGIDWAVAHGADVVNLSLGTSTFSHSIEAAVVAARQQGVVVVAAAGNKGTQALQFPAATDGVLGVASVDQQGSRSWFSTYGSWVDLAAPGQSIATTAPGGMYASSTGTSFAAPAVAGIAALGLSAYPNAPASAVESALLNTALSMSGVVAWGRVEAARFLDALHDEFHVVVPERVAGANRVLTAVELSKRVHDSATTVVIARSDDHADALLAGPLAAQLNAPVLLTATASLSSGVAAEIQRLGASTAWVVGAGVQGSAIASGLTAAGITDVHKLAGASTLATSQLVAQQVGGTRVFVTPVGRWPDAVSVSTLAAMTGSPILFVHRDSVPTETQAALTALGADDITVIGGPAVISDATLSSLRTTGVAVRRLWGANRFETSRVVATVTVAAGADDTETWLATGNDWPDALAAGPAAEHEGAVVLLVDGKRLAGSPTVSSWLTAVGDRLDELVVVGGEVVMTPATVVQLASLVAG